MPYEFLEEIFKQDSVPPQRPTPVAFPQQKPTRAEGILTQYPMTDLGNAERLVSLFSDRMRYCFKWKKWLLWDGVRWNTDDNGALRRLCKGMIRKLQEEALGIEHDETRQKVMKYALGIESDMKIKAMINLAQSEEGVAIRPDDLDQDKYLLTCNNGTIDLKTGKLLKHNPDDLITKLAPVDYLPDAECPYWIAHLKKILGENDELINFIQKVIGYCLTGDTSERAFFILHGGGANGKSITLIVIAWILGDYATRTPTDTLLAKQQDGIPNDVARLKGARMAYASEAEQGKKLAESKVKDLTGGETIVARFLHGEFFEFVPEFKLVLGTNHKPKIRGTDAAIWDRIRLIPFNVRIPEGERIAKEKMLTMFESELPGIFAWMVKGCLAWQKEGLGMPPDVQEATGNYRKEMDVLGDFLEDCCIIDKTETISKKDLYQKYQTWAQENGEREFSKTLLGKMLSERGFDEYRGTGGVREWMGINVQN
jgi:putative DNA primase/helicase